MSEARLTRAEREAKKTRAKNVSKSAIEAVRESWRVITAWAASQFQDGGNSLDEWTEELADSQATAILEPCCEADAEDSLRRGDNLQGLALRVWARHVIGDHESNPMPKTCASAVSEMQRSAEWGADKHGAPSIVDYGKTAIDHLKENHMTDEQRRLLEWRASGYDKDGTVPMPEWFMRNTGPYAYGDDRYRPQEPLANDNVVMSTPEVSLGKAESPKQSEPEPELARGKEVGPKPPEPEPAPRVSSPVTPEDWPADTVPSPEPQARDSEVVEFFKIAGRRRFP